MERPCDTAETSLHPHPRQIPIVNPEPFDPVARMMAHEVRNILTPMRAKAQMALDHLDDQSMGQRALEWAIRASKRIAALTDTILLGAPGETEQVSVCEILHELSDDLPMRNGKKPRVSIEAGDDLFVNTTPTALRHILLNLLLNADRAAATNDGNVNVRCERSTWNTSGIERSGIAITIEDDGRGLDESSLSRLNGLSQEHPDLVVNRSAQTDSKTVSGTSTSVGLFVVERLLSMVGGEIQAVNMPVGGARVTVRIPDQVPESKPAHSQAA